MKKVILSAFTATSLLLSSSPIFAGPLQLVLEYLRNKHSQKKMNPVVK
jgi:hypothetical protein